MKLNKEKLKELLEQESQATVSRDDVEAVVKILSVLEEEDRELRLSANFSERVVHRIVQKQVRENRFGWFGYFLGVLGLVISLAVSVAFVNFKLDLGFLKNISDYSGLFLFGIIFVFLLNLIEKKLLWFSSEGNGDGS